MVEQLPHCDLLRLSPFDWMICLVVETSLPSSLLPFFLFLIIFFFFFSVPQPRRLPRIGRRGGAHPAAEPTAAEPDAPRSDGRKTCVPFPPVFLASPRLGIGLPFPSLAMFPLILFVRVPRRLPSIGRRGGAHPAAEPTAPPSDAKGRSLPFSFLFPSYLFS